MNTARTEVERAGVSTTVRQEVLDPGALYNPSAPAHAVITMAVGTQVDFGRVKVTATVSYQCDQNTATVERAGLLAFEKATSFMNDAIALLAGPPPEPIA